MLQLGDSSGDAAIQGSHRLQRPVLTNNEQKKTVSFSSQTVQTYSFSTIGDNKDNCDESAIDDDNEDWEEASTEESGNSIAEEDINFQHIDSSNHFIS